MSFSLVAEQISGIPFSWIRRVFDRARQLEAGGVKVVHFEIGRPDFDTPLHIKQAASQAMNAGMVHYTPNNGIPKLREALAANIQQFKNVNYDPNTELMVTAGGQEAMYLSLQAFLEPGDEILVPNPGYSQFYSSIILLGGRPVPLPLLETHGFAPDLEAAKELVNERTRGIIVNSPHNPTGALLSRKQIEEISKFAVEENLVLFSDEAYDRIVFEEGTFTSPVSIPEMKERTVVWGSLSKTYSMTGWRIGYIAAPAELVAAAVKVQQNVMLSVCSFAQAGAVAALNGPQECVQQMVEEFSRRRKVILGGIAACPGLECPVDPLGAFYVFARHRVPGISSVGLADYLLEQAGVALVPGVAFGTKGEGYLRISYSTSLEECEEGMDRMRQAMAELLART